MRVTNPNEWDRGSNQALLEWGFAMRALAGADESGDQCLVKSFADGVLVAVVDGLGHGPKAAAVAEMTIAVLREHAHESPAMLLQRCHTKLRGTRGVVMSLASFNAQDDTMVWLSVGNVNGQLLRAAGVPSAKGTAAGMSSRRGEIGLPRERLLLRGGIVGYRLPPLRPNAIPVKRGDTLIFVTDGIRRGFAETIILSDDSPQQIADQIFAQYRRGTDDALVLVARYVGRKTIN
jgi:serine/threonine protein phosphatase PrpC